MNYLGCLTDVNKYTCCGNILTIIDINIEIQDRILIYPIYYCPDCNSCYDNKNDTNNSFSFAFFQQNNILDSDLRRLVFNYLTYTETNTIERALCDYGYEFENKVKDSLATVHEDLRAEMCSIENNLLEIINKNHEDVVKDLRRRVNSFHLA